MRDIVLVLVIVYLMIKALRQLEYGAYLWTWLSLMNPHRMTYGFAFSVPWAMMSAAISLVTLPLSKDRKPLPINGGVITLILLWGWMTVTSIFSINPADLVLERWIFVSKIILMLLLMMMMLRGRQQIDRLVWVVVLSVGFFAVKGGIFTVATGGSSRVWGPPGSMLEENNALAVATIMLLPLVYYLRETASRKWLRLVLGVCMLLMIASALGSQSRGALIALLAMALFLGAKSKHPIRFTLGLVLVLAVAIAFMPDSWTARMETIRDHQEEGSAMSRIYTWRTLLNVAMERPLVGAGFRADNLELFARYAPQDPQFAGFAGLVWVAHSIYMQALGEHGFVGLALFVSIWIWLWFTASRLAREAAEVPELKDWMPLLLRMCQVSTIGYCVGGAFLSLMNVDLPYYLLIFVTLCRCQLQDSKAMAAAPARRTPDRQALGLSRAK